MKKNAIFFKLFWYKVFVHQELKLLNFLVDSIQVTSFNLLPAYLFVFSWEFFLETLAHAYYF